jgi:hypothetical protein
MLKLNFDKEGKKEEPDTQEAIAASPQRQIEQIMTQAVQLGHFEIACLFTEDGLPLAQVGSEDDAGRDLLAEIALHLQEVRSLIFQLENFDGLNEIVFESTDYRKIVFRIVRAFSQNSVLALVVAPHRSYRALANRLVRTVRSLSME